MVYLRKPVLIALLISLLLAGCAGVVKKQIRTAPVQNWLYLHSGAKVGDYALFESFDKSLLMRMQIVGMTPETVEVAISWPRTPEDASLLEQTSYHLFVSPDGTVKYAHRVDTSGNLKPLRVAQAGDFNYIPPMTITPLPAPENIVTRAGSFQIKDLFVFDQKLASLGVQDRVTSVFFVDPSVHFGLVRQTHVIESKLSVPEVIEHIDKFSSTSKPSKSLMGFVSDRSRNRKYMYGMDMVETN